MTNIIGVRFKHAARTYYFDPAGHSFTVGDSVVVETQRGVECGEVVLAGREVSDEAILKPLRPVMRPATPEDIRRVEQHDAGREPALRTCQELIAKRRLDMKLVDAEYTFDGGKLIFYFTADGRVDFRELVKDLASTFHTRIELRQIGPRDEAKMLGGLGGCGRPFCCAQFLTDFAPVSIKMAKEQGLSLNPTKISGACGKLMCCLRFEVDAYSDLSRLTPRVGATVQTAEGRGTVTEVNLLTGQLSVRLDKAPDSPVISVNRRDVKMMRNHHPKLTPPEEPVSEELEELEE